jgi:hypothetical protein
MNRWCPVEMETLKLLESEFHHDGRRPELQRVVWAFDGKIPQGFDYYNPEDTYEEENNLVGGSQQATPPGHRGSYLPPNRVIGGSCLPPIPTERSVRIWRVAVGIPIKGTSHRPHRTEQGVLHHSAPSLSLPRRFRIQIVTDTQRWQPTTMQCRPKAGPVR